jgi:hypothetical protein
MRLAVVLAKLCATESPTIFATGQKDSGNRLIGIPYRLAIIGQWARLFTQLTTFRTMTCFGESNGSAVLVTTRAFQAIPYMLRHATGYKLANDGQDTRAIQQYG